MARLTIRLLGAFHVTLDGETLSDFESNKVRALLAYLAVGAERSHSRQTLATLLWPEQPERAARHNLRQALSNLRSTLHEREADPPCLLVTRGTVQFNLQSDHWLDVTELSQHVAVSQAHGHARIETCEACLQHLAQAVALYQGEFLQGLFVDDSLPFEEWAALQRERYHRLALDALYHLAQTHERRRDYARARRYARRQVELEPWREEAHQQLMRTLARGGQRSAALAQYQICRRTLAEELGVEPSAETQALYWRIRAAGDAPPSHGRLPEQLTPFVGREAELAEIAERLTDPTGRLLTLVGPGGVGKTRLALQAAAEQRSAFLNGVFFVPLTPLSTAEFLPTAIAEALGLSLSGDLAPRAQLLDYLRDKEMLLVLDNWEHLLEGIDLLLEILQQAPDVKVLATSREPLNLRAEWLLDVQGLALPEQDATERLDAYSAVRLFVESARRVRTDFTLSAETAPAVSAICRLVQGTPLAIELAAAMTRTYACGQIASHIEKDLDFLATTMADVSPRHRSLRAVFDHSWGLLDKPEREVLARLSVFRGPFRPEAARAVAGAAASLENLVTKSLLSQDQAARYSLHSLLKQYASEKLTSSPEENTKTSQRHCDHYAGWIQRQEEALRSSQQRQALAEIGAEIEDVRAAWQWAIARRRVEILERFVEGLHLFYWARNWFQEGAAAFEQAAQVIQAQQHPLLLAKMWTRQASFIAWLGHYGPARDLLRQSLELAQTPAGQSELAYAHEIMGHIAYWTGDYTAAREHFEADIGISCQIEDRYRLAQALNGLANVICDETADYDQAQPLYAESLALARQIGDQFGVAKVLINLGASAQELGQYAQAQQLYQDSLEIYRSLGYRRGLSAVLNNLGQVASHLGELETAHELMQESLDLKREIGNRNAIVYSLLHLGELAGKAREPHEAKGWYGQALRLALDIRAPHLARYALVGLAELWGQQGQTGRALELLSFVLHQDVGEQELKGHARRLLSELANGLDPETVARYQARGHSKTLVALAAEVLKETPME